MSTEKDAGQSGKKGVVLVVAALVLIAGISYVGMGWFQPQERTQSRLALSAASVRTGTTTDETAHYRELLRQDNDQGAAEAEKTIHPSWPVFPVAWISPSKTQTREKPANPVTTKNAQHGKITGRRRHSNA